MLMVQPLLYERCCRMKCNSGTKAHFREVLREAGVNFELSDHFYREIVLSMNGAKGQTGEFLDRFRALR